MGSAWMVGLTLPPFVLSRAVDDGLEPGHLGALAAWCAVLLAVGVVNAWLAIMRHRTMTKVRLDGAFRTVQVVVEHATRLGLRCRAGSRPERWSRSGSVMPRRWRTR